MNFLFCHHIDIKQKSGNIMSRTKKSSKETEKLRHLFPKNIREGSITEKRKKKTRLTTVDLGPEGDDNICWKERRWEESMLYEQKKKR